MSISSLENQVSELYEEILLRKPDKTGLYFFVTKLKQSELTLDDIRDMLLNSDEGKNIHGYSHYSDKYWNDLPRVKQYKNELSTGNKDVHWVNDILTRFKQFVPFQNVLIVGCGNGWLERQLYDTKIGLQFDAFDISEKYLEEAKKLANDRPINYFKEDINEMTNIKENTYDAIFNFAILHHTEKIDFAMKQLSKALKPDGIMFNEEYIGPAQNQYSDIHLKHMLEVMSDLPEKYKSPHQLRPNIENFRVEPTEAIHSDLVKSSFEKYFETIYEKNMNGGIAYMILWNNIKNFQDPKSEESVKWLEYLLKCDREFSEEGKVPILFWYGVGKSRIKN